MQIKELCIVSKRVDAVGSMNYALGVITYEKNNWKTDKGKSKGKYKILCDVM